MEDFMKSTAVDRLSGSSDTVWMPWPVRPDFPGSVFFSQLMDETPLIRYPWNMQWLNSFSLHSSF